VGEAVFILDREEDDAFGRRRSVRPDDQAAYLYLLIRFGRL